MTEATTLDRLTRAAAAAFLAAVPLPLLAADEPAPDQTEPAPALSDFLPDPVSDPPSEAPEPAAAGSASRIATEPRDAIDASAPHDADLAKLLRRAESLVTKGEWARAQEVLLFTLDRANGAVVRLTDGSLAPVTEEANRLLGQVPSEVLDLYRRQYGGAAARALDEAVRTGRQDVVEQVATQFRQTDAGRRAIERLAAVHLDRGEFGLAARRFRELLEIGASLQPRTRIKAISAFLRSGDEETARDLAADLDEKEKSTLFDGEGDTTTPPPVAEDWRSPFGDPAHASVALPGEPLLLRRWSRPLTDRANVREQAERVASDLRDSGRATVPAALPLAIGDHVIVRTLRGVEVYSAANGELLWETEEGLSPERLLSGEGEPVVEPDVRIFRFRGQFGPDPTRGDPGEQNGLAGLLYRDGVTGFLSADAERLYVIEENASLVRPQPGFGWEEQEGDPYGRDRSSNRLAAYDLDTGRPAWPGQGGVGGGLTGGPFERPLAGYFFFGPPTPVGDELYVVGEKAKEIRLLALDPQTGELLWDRLLAHAQVGIDQDAVRRLWPAQVGAAEGVLICPTTAGWLVAIEQSSHSILWAYRYAPPQPGRGEVEAGLAAPATVLNSRWSPSAPIIKDGKVVFTPSEEARLVCLDLYTGELAWRQGKGSALYVAGVTGDLIVSVGTSAVTGLDLKTGATRWSAKLDAETGLPSGRAALTADALYLPLQGELLRTIDLRTGGVLGDLSLSSGDGTLGNLLLHRGKLLSFAADGLTAFEERTGLTQSIADRLRMNPADAAALLQRAELELADGKLNTAAATLDQITPSRTPPEHRPPVHRVRWRILTELVRAGGDDAEPRLRELAALAETDEERLTARRLEADSAFAAGDLSRASAACLAILEAGALDRNVSDEDHTTVRLDAWLAGRFTDLWTKSDERARTALTESIESQLAAASDDAERDRLAAVFPFHPAAAAVVRDLAAKNLTAGHFAEAEARLLPLARREGETSKQAQLELAKLAGNPAAGPSADLWGGFRLAVVRSGAYTAAETTNELRPESGSRPLDPFFRDRQLRLLLQQDRLAVSGPAGDGLEKLVPLRVGNRSGASAVAAADGHLLFLLYRNVVQLISAVEGRVIWSAPAGEDALGSGSEPAPEPMHPAGSAAASSGLIARARSRGAMPAANANYVALRSRRELTVLDAPTGSVRWTRKDVPRGATVVGTESLLYILPAERGRGAGEATVLRTLDGRPVERPEAVKRLPYAVAAIGDRLLTVTAEQTFSLFNLRLGQSIVSLIDPETGEPVWSRTYPQDALFDLTPDGRLFVLNSDGALAALDPETGEPTTLGEVPRDVLARRNEAFLLTDSGAAYLVVNSGRAAITYYPSDLPAIAVHGEVFAFDLAGGFRWRRPIENRRLLCQEFGASPVLLFADSEMIEKNNRTFWRVDLLALDKRSGEPVLDEPYHSQSTPFFRGMAVQPDRRSIELGAYPVRLRLQAVAKPADE